MTKILVADDSPVIVAAVGELLSRQGYDVATAKDGVEAIQKFYTELPDVVLLDLEMPGLSGYVACRMIKEDWSVSHIPVLILTAQRMAEDRYWAEKSGADGFIIKDDIGDELITVVRQVSASRALSELTGDGDRERTPLTQADVLARVCKMLDRKLFETSIVNDIVTLSTRVMDLRKTMHESLTIVGRIVEYDVAGVALIDDKAVAVRTVGGATREEIQQFRALVSGHVEQLADERIDPNDMQVWLEDPATSVRTDLQSDGLNSFFAMALRSRGEVLGVLAIAARKPAKYPPQVVRTTRMIESPLSMVLDSAYHHQKVLEEEARQSLSALYQS